MSSRHPKPVATSAPAPLTPDERRLVDAYRAMDQQAKGEVLATALRKAEHYPDRPRPKLRLVENANGAPA